MGLVGGPHCVAMCGAACAGIGRAAGARSTRALWSFQVSRMVGYALLGAFAAGTVQGLALLGTQTITIRPLWTMFHAAAFLLGLALIWRARQPAWIETLGQGVWRKARPALTRLGGKAPVHPGRGLGVDALWLAVFGAAGGIAVGQCLGRRSHHGAVLHRHIGFTDGCALVVAALARRRFGFLGDPAGGPGLGGHLGVGALDGLDQPDRAVLPLGRFGPVRTWTGSVNKPRSEPPVLPVCDQAGSPAPVPAGQCQMPAAAWW